MSNKATTTMIVLVGEQPMAIIIPVFQDPPEKTEARNALYELDSVAGLMRARRYCRKALITACHNIPASAVERAKNSEIRITTGSELPRLGSIISEMLRA